MPKPDTFPEGSALYGWNEEREPNLRVVYRYARHLFRNYFIFWDKPYDPYAGPFTRGEAEVFAEGFRAGVKEERNRRALEEWRSSARRSRRVKIPEAEEQAEEQHEPQ
jgi:hypothetical protein